MNQLSEILKDKFEEYQIPVNIAYSFLTKYRMFEQGLLPEMELRTIPSDDCFRTLQVFCNTVIEKPDDFLVYRLLQIPFAHIQAAKDKLLNFMDASAVEECYQNAEMYFVCPEFIDELRILLQSKNILQVDYSKWFVEALVLGKSAADIINRIFVLLDEHTAKSIISQAAIWYPYSDVVGLIEYLLEQGLTNAQIGKLLIEDPMLIMHYRKEGCRAPRFGHSKEYVDHVITKIKTDK